MGLFLNKIRYNKILREMIFDFGFPLIGGSLGKKNEERRTWDR